jgi:hypothetical protein
MSGGTIKFIIAAVLFLHGIAHIGPVSAYLWIKSRPQDPTSGWIAARSWLAPGLPARAATIVATVFWAFSLVGFVVAALAFTGILVPAGLWSQLAVVSAVISTLGIFAFFGTWPMFNALAALGVNAAVLVTQLILHWPPPTMFGG